MRREKMGNGAGPPHRWPGPASRSRWLRDCTPRSVNDRGLMGLVKQDQDHARAVGREVDAQFVAAQIVPGRQSRAHLLGGLFPRLMDACKGPIDCAFRRTAVRWR